MTALSLYTNKDLDTIAKQLKGNWRKFDSFIWGESPEDEDAWTIVYTHHRDSDLIDVANAEAISKAMQPYLDGDDLREEDHNHWAHGWMKGYSIRVERRDWDGVDTNYEARYTAPLLKWVELAQKIADYPLLDEEIHSRLEEEAFDKSWESWIRQDFIAEVNQVLQIEIGEAQEEKTFELYHQLKNETSARPAVESGGVFINLKALCSEVALSNLHSVGIPYTTEAGVPSTAIQTVVDSQEGVSIDLSRRVLDDFEARGFGHDIAVLGDRLLVELRAPEYKQLSILAGDHKA